MKEIYFTKHSKDKISLLVEHGFNLSEEYIISSIKNPDTTLLKGNQKLFLRFYDDTHAIQIICEETEEKIKVITIFPVRRRRYGI